MSSDFPPDPALDRYELAVEATAEGIWDWIDVEGDEEWWSPQFYRLLGYEPGELPASLAAFQELLHPDDHAHTFAAVNAAFEQDKPFEVEYRLRLKSGAYRWFRGRARVFRNQDGRARRMLGSIDDIHERLAATRALVRTELELSRRNSELERFLYTASHDLKAPLFTIRGFIEHIVELIEANQLEKVPKYASRIEAAAVRMNRKIESILQLSKTGREAPVYHPLSIEPILTPILAEYASQLSDKRAKVQIDLALESVPMGQEHATTVLENLVSNAIRHGLHGETPTLRIAAARAEEGGFEFVVEDDGPGIEEAYRAKVFELFERLSTDKNSTGVGLTIVAGIADLYGGSAAVSESELGGARVRVHIPSPATENGTS